MSAEGQGCRQLPSLLAAAQLFAAVQAGTACTAHSPFLKNVQEQKVHRKNKRAQGTNQKRRLAADVAGILYQHRQQASTSTSSGGSGASPTGCAVLPRGRWGDYQQRGMAEFAAGGGGEAAGGENSYPLSIVYCGGGCSATIGTLCQPFCCCEKHLTLF